jgi:hypothetical protein
MATLVGPWTVELVTGDQRSHIVADADVSGVLYEFVDRVFLDEAVDEQSGAARAHLPGVGAEHVYRTLNGGLEIGVGEYHISRISHQVPG